MFRKRRILLIDDEEDFCFFVAQNLFRSGRFVVTYATDPNKGPRIAKKDPPDLILLDILMPRKNGFEVLKILKKNPKTEFIPVILLTGIKDEGTRIKGIQLYSEGCISKPVDYKLLIKEIDRSLNLLGMKDK